MDSNLDQKKIEAILDFINKEKKRISDFSYKNDSCSSWYFLALCNIEKFLMGVNI